MAGRTATTAALGYMVLGLYRRREAKARVAAGRGELGDPYKGASERRRRPTATGGGMESSGSERERPIRIDLESTNFQSEIDDVSKGEKVEWIAGINFPLSISPDQERDERIWKGGGGAARLGFGRATAGGGRQVRQVGPTYQRLRERRKERGGLRLGCGPTWAWEEREKVSDRLSA